MKVIFKAQKTDRHYVQYLEIKKDSVRIQPSERADRFSPHYLKVRNPLKQKLICILLLRNRGK